MMRLVLIFLIFSSTCFAQDLKINKATVQTLNHGASPTSSITYTIFFTKVKKGKWSIDSLISSSSGQNIKFNIAEVDHPDAVSPDCKKVAPKDLKKGNYQITFGKVKKRGVGRPGSPQDQKADTTNIEGAVLICYTIKKKHLQIRIDNFETLETVNAP
jgi:hypothetical protein